MTEARCAETDCNGVVVSEGRCVGHLDEDASTAYAAGVSREALRDAATVSSLFNMITRLADSFGWDVPSWDRTIARAPAMLEGGYSFAAMRQR